MDHRNEPGPIAVQIAGADPARLAQAARYHAEHGVQIVDINMGCPAKKVCNAEAGSALMRDERLVAKLCEAVVQAVDIPVTLKIRTGWARDQRNGLQIAKIAEASGIAALAIHGRTREDLYGGNAEYDTIALIKQSISIPIWANGDIDSPHKAKQVLQHTGVDGLMIGRAAQGRPWIFQQVHRYLVDGTLLPDPSLIEIGQLLLEHLSEVYELYGERAGVRIARKHIQWYCQAHPDQSGFWKVINRVEHAETQRNLVADFFGITAPAACTA